MMHLDDFAKAKMRINQANVSSVLFPNEQEQWRQLSEDELDHRLKRLCTMPLCNEDFTVVYSLYMRLKWLDVLNNVAPKNGASILEVGSGSSTNIPYAMTVYDTNSRYITANMNKDLTAGLRHGTSSLPISIEIIEDDANNIKNYIEPDKLDAVVFEHSVNDVLQAILGEHNGIDTTNNDWFAVLPDMIKMISDAYVNGTLADKVKEPFLSLISNCLSVIQPGGYMAMSHYMFQYDLDLGYNADLWQNMLQVIRPWMKELSIGREVYFEGFDSQWWLFYQK